jgi:hypothetical protein
LLGVVGTAEKCQQPTKIGSSWLLSHRRNFPRTIDDRWTAARSERNESITRQFYTDGAGAVRVEGVLVEGLPHAFPIRVRATG